jgi:hypothetical protein
VRCTVGEAHTRPHIQPTHCCASNTHPASRLALTLFCWAGQQTNGRRSQLTSGSHSPGRGGLQCLEVNVIAVHRMHPPTSHAELALAHSFASRAMQCIVNTSFHSPPSSKLTRTTSCNTVNTGKLNTSVCTAAAGGCLSPCPAARIGRACTCPLPASTRTHRHVAQAADPHGVELRV